MTRRIYANFFHGLGENTCLLQPALKFKKQYTWPFKLKKLYQLFFFSFLTLLGYQVNVVLHS